MRDYLFTSQSVTQGHPDKMADQISDALLDSLLQQDKNSKLSCETLISNGFCVIAGELTTQAYIPMQDIAREVIRYIGYTDSAYGFDYRTAGLLNAIGEESPDILQNRQQNSNTYTGVVSGFACNDTKTLIPYAIYYAHKLTRGLSNARKDGTLPFLRPDGKAQITVSYKDNKPYKIEKILISSQHSPDVSLQKLKEAIIEDVIYKQISKNILSDNIEYIINPNGLFTIGGPRANAGMTGRKLAVDTYGGYASCGGSALSGKDPSNIDRSGAYMARYIAKNLVASGVCDKVYIQLAYVEGQDIPVSITVDTKNTSVFDNNILIDCIKNIFDLSPQSIITNLDLLQPIYQQTASFGHFGREDVEFSWEKIDKIEAIKEYLKV